MASRSLDSITVQRLFEHRTKKAPLVAHDELQRCCFFHQTHTFGIVCCCLPVLLVLGKGGEAEEAVGDVVGAFGR